MNQEKFIKYLSWVATGMSVMMYVSYLPQIANNLSGMKGNPIQPLVATINCGFSIRKASENIIKAALEAT